LGEDTKELLDGQVVSTEGSWEAGVDNARAGIFMPATPQVGQAFKQEDANKVAEDCSKIVDLNTSVKTGFVSSNQALKTEEFSLLEPGVLDNKFYVRGIGLVREQTVQGGGDFLELVSVTTP
jgi:phage terminase large subunit